MISYIKKKMNDIKYNGFYLGVVIQNNDPEKRGRIKIFVPHISTTVYEKFNKSNENKEIKFPGKYNSNDLENIIKELKDLLPWGEYAGPLFGGSASGRYNAITQNGTTSDSNLWIGDDIRETGRPLQVFTNTGSFPDAFSETDKNFNHFANPNAYQYTPSDYSTLARGLFTIPNVGSHVWLWFREGDPMFPVYFASSYGEEDFKRIYTLSSETDNNTCVDYPASYENINKDEEGKIDADTKTFRAKTVLNTNKHSIELIDTDLREILKFTHYSGSFLEFNNIATIQLATANDQKMVIGDQFLTVRKNQSIYVAESQDIIIAGDQYTTVGNVPEKIVKDIYTIMKEIHNVKYLFDVQRANEGEAPNYVAKGQKRIGSPLALITGGFAVCPVCKGLPYPETAKYNMMLIHAYISKGDCCPLGSDRFTPLEQPTVPVPVAINRLGAPIRGLGFYKGSPCDVCNPLDFDFTLDHFPGESPSTYDGFWMPETKKTLPILNALMVEKTKKLLDFEKSLTNGGDQIISVHKNKIETIGLIVNDLPAIRIDPVGKLRVNGVHVSVEEVYETFRATPYIEQIAVDDVPGGDYVLTVGNRYKLLVGSNGINIKTFGNIDMHGSIINMTGDQVNISSQNEVNLDGGERLNLRARNISIMPFEHNPIVLDGQINISRNVIVKGGQYIEGELGLQHVTAPVEWQMTEFGGAPPHFHYFKAIPTTFCGVKEQVRDLMIIAGINSTDTLVAAKAITGPGTGFDSAANADAKNIADAEFIRWANSTPDNKWSDWVTDHPNATPPVTNVLSNMITAGDANGNGKVVNYTYTYNWAETTVEVVVQVTYTVSASGETSYNSVVTKGIDQQLDSRGSPWYDGLAQGVDDALDVIVPFRPDDLL